MRGLTAWAVLAICVGTFTAAGCAEQDLSKPPKMRYGRDACAQCRMILGDERFACAAAASDKRMLKFDDIGCLAVYEKKQAGRDLRSWVHDAGTGVWIKKKEAKFVHARDLITPMGFGLAAFATVEDAEKFAREKNGRVVSWEELLSTKNE